MSFPSLNSITRREEFRSWVPPFPLLCGCSPCSVCCSILQPLMLSLTYSWDPPSPFQPFPYHFFLLESTSLYAVYLFPSLHYHSCEGFSGLVSHTQRIDICIIFLPPLHVSCTQAKTCLSCLDYPSIPNSDVSTRHS